MLRFAAPLHVAHVVTYLGMVLRLIAVTLIVPLGVSAIVREFEFTASFGAVLAVCAIVGWLLGRERPSRLARREAIIVTALAYPTFSLLGGLALLPGMAYIDGIFETMSGVTTTGLTVLDLRDTPSTILYFRAYIQWIGGMGIIVLSIAVLFSTAGSSMHLFASEYGEENVAGNVVATAKIMLRVYAVLTVIAVALLLSAGMSPQDAALHGLTAISTGGFSPYPESIAHFDSIAIQGTLVLIMLAGAISFPLYYIALVRGWRWLLLDAQMRSLASLALLSSAVFVIASPWTRQGTMTGVFNAVSALTGTGFAVGDPIVWPSAAFGLAIVLMAIGGSAGSTTGGIKQSRLGIAAKAIGRAATVPNLPEHAKMPLRYNREVIDEPEVSGVLAVVGLYVALLVASGVALTFAGVSAADALFEASSAVGTVGLSAGLTGPDAASWVKGILIVDMWAGRLEMVPLAVLIVNVGLLVQRRTP